MTGNKKKDTIMIKISLTDEDRERAKGKIIQALLKAESKYVNKSDQQLLKIWKYQVWLHNFACFGSRDDIENILTQGILLERGFTKEKLRKIYNRVIKEGKIEMDNFHKQEQMLSPEGQRYNSAYNRTEWIETIIRNLDYPMAARLELKFIRDDITTIGHTQFIETIKSLKKNRGLFWLATKGGEINK